MQINFCKKATHSYYSNTIGILKTFFQAFSDTLQSARLINKNSNLNVFIELSRVLVMKTMLMYKACK